MLYQCSIPVFEGLLPKTHNNSLMDILFTLAHWHALAKLRQHTDMSLDILQSITIHLGELLRDFQKKTCADYNTKELDREMTARARKAAKKSSAVPRNTSTNIQTSAATTGKQRKTLNLNTYKDHSLGDYVESIRRNGTIDSYSTESVSTRPLLSLYILNILLS